MSLLHSILILVMGRRKGVHFYITWLFHIVHARFSQGETLHLTKLFDRTARSKKITSITFFSDGNHNNICTFELNRLHFHIVCEILNLRLPKSVRCHWVLKSLWAEEDHEFQSYEAARFPFPRPFPFPFPFPWSPSSGIKSPSLGSLSSSPPYWNLLCLAFVFVTLKSLKIKLLCGKKVKLRGILPHASQRDLASLERHLQRSQVILPFPLALNSNNC